MTWSSQISSYVWMSGLAYFKNHGYQHTEKQEPYHKIHVHVQQLGIAYPTNNEYFTETLISESSI